MAAHEKNRRAVVVAAVIAAVIVGAVVVRSRANHEPGPLSLGRSVTTPDGRVTVYGWKPPPTAEGAPGGSVRSEIDVRSCRVEARGTVLDAGGFGLEMPDGRRVVPNGSKITDGGPSCVRAAISFLLPAGSTPRYVTFTSESSTYRWPVHP